MRYSIYPLCQISFIIKDIGLTRDRFNTSTLFLLDNQWWAIPVLGQGQKSVKIEEGKKRSERVRKWVAGLIFTSHLLHGCPQNFVGAGGGAAPDGGARGGQGCGCPSAAGCWLAAGRTLLGWFPDFLLIGLPPITSCTASSVAGKSKNASVVRWWRSSC